MLSGKDTLNLLFMVTTSSLLAWVPISKGSGNSIDIFTYHPLFMGFGLSLMVQLGFWMFNYEDLPGSWIDTRNSRRKAHVFCQLTGFVLIICGYVAIVRAHQSNDAALFAVSAPPLGFSSGPKWVRLIHVILGYCTLSLIPLQLTVGVLKYRALTDEDDNNDGAYSIHELIGNSFYSCGMGNLMIGIWLWEGYSIPIRAVISLTLMTSMVFGPRWDGSRGYLSDAVPTRSGS